MEKESIIHEFDGKAAPQNKAKVADSTNANSTKFMTKQTLIIFAVVIIIGIGTGFVFATKKSSTVSVAPGANISNLKKGTVFGSDEKTFKDSAEGILRIGGINGEGAYHLERPGGDSQNVYLTSSVLDLSKLVGKKIKVWGETNSAQTAGWLMDVGRAQVVE